MRNQMVSRRGSRLRSLSTRAIFLVEQAKSTQNPPCSLHIIWQLSSDGLVVVAGGEACLKCLAGVLTSADLDVPL